MSAPDPKLYMKPIFEPTTGGGPICTGFKVFVGERNTGQLSISKDVYYTWRNELRHFARIPEGYGIEKSLADRLFAPGTSLKAVVLVIEHENGRRVRYWTPTWAWRDEGRVLTLSPDYGSQVFLSFRYIQELDRKYRAQENVYSGPAEEGQEVLAS